RGCRRSAQRRSPTRRAPRAAAARSRDPPAPRRARARSRAARPRRRRQPAARAARPPPGSRSRFSCPRSGKGPSSGEEERMGKRITELMTPNPRTIDQNKPVSDAAKMMRDEDVGLAPIVDGDRLVGTVTDRDIAIRSGADGKDPQTTKVMEIASRELITIDPQQDLDEAMKLMARHQVRRLPVVEEDGKLIGVVAQADIAKHASGKKTGE